MTVGFKNMKRVIFTACLVLMLLVVLILSPAALAAERGDINGDGVINVIDVVLVMRHVLEQAALSDARQALADVNSDGIINILDVSLIMKKSLGLIKEFPKPPDLIKSFSVYDGIIPGKKFVIVTLTVTDPQRYEVKVGETALRYNETVNGFMGEVNEADALRSKAVVSRL